MKKYGVSFAIVVATTAVALFGAVYPADAKTKAKPTYEQAWALCIAELNHSHIPRDNGGARQAAGGACMHRHGYRL